MTTNVATATIFIPTALRGFTGGAATHNVPATTVGEALAQLTAEYSDLKQHLFSDEGKLRSFVNIYVGEDDIRYLNGADTELTEGARSHDRPVDRRWCGRATGRRDNALNEEIMRYSRHLIMPEVALSGQEKLKAAKVLLIGAGGLGAPLGLYLAAAGVGTIGVVDSDVVDVTNLQRQVIYATSDIDRPKLEASAQRLRDLNPHIKIVPYEVRLTSENALEIFKDYDIIIDGTDNFPTRYLVNDACVMLGKPNVYGSIFRFEGQISVFDATQGPCYRCLYPEPPPPGLVPSCAEGGVLGVLPGTVGVMQATEAVKLILGIGEPLVGRLLRYDALGMRFKEYKLRKDPHCPVCGENPTVTELIDYMEFCGVMPEPKPTEVVAPEWQITPVELAAKRAAGWNPLVVDVREPHEREIGLIPDSVLIPVGEIPARIHELDSSRDIVLYCRSGVRSARALEQLRTAGFTKLKNLTGGILAWSDDVDSSIPKY
ncbi:MAG: molybdopterin-synthase adenylyltransferase MoeB [Thermomicrobiales bacterium]|nr:molybdopterin-synthase adenylyltransferase MoeB [Thermomicrobiales bacterium]